MEKNNDNYTISYNFSSEENSNISASGAIDLRSNRNRPIQQKETRRMR
jgi:hypothetical protein